VGRFLLISQEQVPPSQAKTRLSTILIGSSAIIAIADKGAGCALKFFCSNLHQIT
jgi:hypothetical protein